MNMIFCTGGIRCHKGIAELHNRGYHNVWQLKGGILRYLELHPHKNFEGDCFVFDYRVAVGQDLQPTPDIGLCPHRGDPARDKIACIRCGQEGYVCMKCRRDEITGSTCSKDCAYHWRMRPGIPLRS